MSTHTIRRATVDDMIGRIVEYAKTRNLERCSMATDEGRPIYERAGFRADDRYLRWR